MASNIQQALEADLELYNHNPTAIFKSSLKPLVGLDVANANNPFAFLLEVSATHTSAAIDQFRNNMYGTYASFAQTWEDLYRHMADNDYKERFATPSRTSITLAIPVVDVLAAAADAGNGQKRITIPRDSIFEYGGYKWYIHYPIDIRISASNIIQVAYDLTVESPLKAANSNVLNYRTQNAIYGDLLVIDIPVEQIGVTSLNVPTSPSAPFITSVSFTDQFYYIRAYHSVDGAVWDELSITHSAITYDRSKPTMVVNVNDGYVKCSIPEIYTTEGQIGNTIRIDVYTTRGVLNIDLADYSSSDARGQFLDLNDNTTPYMEAIANLNSIQYYAGNDAVVSGSNGLTLEEMRERVIFRSTSDRMPVTLEEITFDLDNMGYKLVKGNDTQSERNYLCSRQIDAPISNSLKTPIGVRADMISMNTTIGDYGDGLVVNGDRFTLTDKAIFKENNGITNLLTQTEVDDLKDNPTELLIGELNDWSYFFTPFFYVMEDVTGIYNIRPYYLDSPVCTARNFIAMNEDLWYTVQTSDIEIARKDNIFEINVTTIIPNGFNTLNVQLRYVDENNQSSYLTAKEVTYEGAFAKVLFELKTTFDIDSDHRMEFIGLTSETGNDTNAFIPLVSEFDVLYYAESTVTLKTEFDNIIQSKIEGNWVAISHETATLDLGSYLDLLSVRGGPYIVEPTYFVYEEDTIEYLQDEYARDEDGKLIFNKVDGNYSLVKDVSPDRSILHKKGTRVRVNGELVPLTDKKVIWEISPLLLDAKYTFATSADAGRYRQLAGNTVYKFMESDLRPFTPNLQGRTKLSYQPKTTVGSTLAVVEGKHTVSLNTQLSFTIVFMLTDAGFQNTALKIQLRKNVLEALRDILYTDTFSISTTHQKLTNLSSEIVSVEISNPIDGYSVAIIEDADKEFSLKSRLFERTNGVIDIEDDVDIEFRQRKYL